MSLLLKLEMRGLIKQFLGKMFREKGVRKVAKSLVVVESPAKARAISRF